MFLFILNHMDQCLWWFEIAEWNDISLFKIRSNAYNTKESSQSLFTKASVVRNINHIVWFMVICDSHRSRMDMNLLRAYRYIEICYHYIFCNKPAIHGGYRKAILPTIIAQKYLVLHVVLVYQALNSSYTEFTRCLIESHKRRQRNKMNRIYSQ